ncbi:hypothetical protein M422DRAFT_25564 [Sphaerobolus stellatus SS14]|nr:hypothetical protein M422DRAFT_25564 [Sphaerobolus stellatus SS14]
MSDDNTQIKELFQRYQRSPTENLLPDEVNIIIDSFIPSRGTASRAHALLLLSKFVSDLRKKYASSSDNDVATLLIVKTFSPSVEARLGDTEELAATSGLAFFASFFQIDALSASEMFARDGVLDTILDMPDIYPSSESIPVAIANLLSQASSQKTCRTLITSHQIKFWLERGTKQTKNTAFRAAAAVVLVKLSQGPGTDEEPGVKATTSGSSTDDASRSSDELVDLMKNLVVSDQRVSSASLDAVEGLAYLTVKPSVKDALSKDHAFIKSLFALLPHRPQAVSFPASHADRTSTQTTLDTDLGLNYGIAVIIMHLCAFRPRLSDEEQQIAKLRRMTKQPAAGSKLSASASAESDMDRLDDDEHVKARCRRLMNSDVVDALAGIVKQISGGEETRSLTAQRAVAIAFLSLAEEKENRGEMLQQGASKALLAIIRTSMKDFSSGSVTSSKKAADLLDSQDLPAIQALAKLTITSSPLAVFGPGQAYLDAVRPFATLLGHSSSSLLQKFEALMALTNVASISPEAASRISSFHFGKITEKKSQVGDIVKVAEGHLLDNNTMVRRAAVELICNLVGGDEAAFEYFGGTPESNASSKLHILAALSDVEDLPTRLAASGALAVLTASPFACKSLAVLEMERHRIVPILVELIAPDIAKEYREEDEDEEESFESEGVRMTNGDPGLVHRGIVCVRNLFANLDGKDERKAMAIEADKRGLVRALVHVVKTSSGPSSEVIVRPAAEVLKWILQAGIKLPI